MNLWKYLRLLPGIGILWVASCQKDDYQTPDPKLVEAVTFDHTWWQDDPNGGTEKIYAKTLFAVTPAGRTVALMEGRLFEKPFREFTLCDISPDGKRVLVNCNSKTIYEYDLERGTPDAFTEILRNDLFVRRIKYDPCDIDKFAFIEAPNRGYAHRLVRMDRQGNRTLLAQIDTERADLFFTPDGKNLVVSLHSKGEFYRFPFRRSFMDGIAPFWSNAGENQAQGTTGTIRGFVAAPGPGNSVIYWSQGATPCICAVDSDGSGHRTVWTMPAGDRRVNSITHSPTANRQGTRVAFSYYAGQEGRYVCRIGDFDGNSITNLQNIPVPAVPANMPDISGSAALHAIDRKTLEQLAVYGSE